MSDIDSALRPVVAFCGAAKSGKDEAARFLVEEYGYTRLAFADPLKEEFANQLIDPTPDWLRFVDKHCYASWPLTVVDFLVMDQTQVDPLAYTLAHKDQFRSWWQIYGTEYRRAQDEDYWVKLIRIRMRPGKRYVFSDYRFPNEGALAAEMGGVRCLLRRDGAGAGPTGVPGHVSERPDTLDREVDFNNNGSLEALQRFSCWLARL